MLHPISSSHSNCSVWRHWLRLSIVLRLSVAVVFGGLVAACGDGDVAFTENRTSLSGDASDDDALGDDDRIGADAGDENSGDAMRANGEVSANGNDGGDSDDSTGDDNGADGATNSGGDNEGGDDGEASPFEDLVEALMDDADEDDPANVEINDDTVAQAEDVLRTMCEGTRQTMVQEVVFSETVNDCSWGMNGNLEYDYEGHEQVIAARREQAIAMNLPNYAYLCDMAFEFPTQYMEYDDEILLTFDDVILTASQTYDAADEFETKAGFLIYDWNRIVGKEYPIHERPQYFIDPSCDEDDCSIPPTQTLGQMSFAMSSDVAAKASAYAGLSRAINSETAQHKFRFITTGDNNNNADCRHKEFRFNVTLEYVVPAGR